MRTISCRLGIAIALLVAASGCWAAQLTVISTLNMRPALDELVGPFESATGNHVLLESQPATPTRLRIERGDPGDVAIHTRGVLEALVRAGKLRPRTLVDIAHASIGVIIRAGASPLDISSDERLRQVLLGASAITYPDPAEGSIGGNYLADLFNRWGISTRLQGKLILAGGGAAAGHIVAAGRAQLGLNQIAELMTVPQIEFLSPVPPALDRVIVMSAGVLSNAREPEAAAAWIRFLASRRAARALRAHGLEP